MEIDQPNRYRSAFRSWDTTSWVRAKPHRTAPFDASLCFFTPDAVPLLALPEARWLRPEAREELSIRHLQWYLAMTVPLELGPVNDACTVIRDSAHSVAFPRGLRHDALRLYADEGGHAEMMSGMCDDVEVATGIAPPASPPQFVRRISELVRDADPAHRDLVRFAGGLVSETLISITLARVPLDDRVQLAVRQLLADHADDERRHGAFFRDAVSRLWPLVDADARRAVGVLIPAMLRAFLEPDRDELVATAALYPEAFPDAAAAAEGAVQAITGSPGFVDSASPTLRALREAGVFADAEVAEAFRAEGFLPGPTHALVTA
ncbi:MAG TPA: diiron oxygenase [Acidimicrobiales bacterium]